MLFNFGVCASSRNRIKSSQPDDLKAPTTRQTLPLPPPSVPEQPRKITQEEREFNAYKTLRNNRAETRFEGVRKIRAAKVSFYNSLRLACSLKGHHGFPEGGRGGGQKEVVLYLPLPLLLAPSCMHWMTQYMIVCAQIPPCPC